ncbi:MAG TPA: galactonate dehydratase [Balneolaceae bacterium]|nr:galactonate dehydratase [Balneolaceae bacterium]
MDTIKRITLFKVSPRWLFVKITTAEGIEGWGEPTLEGKADTVAAAVREFRDELIGADPSRIEDLFQRCYRGQFYRGGPVLMSALSGIEQALWDIKGKRLGVPAYELLGGAVRDKMKVYAWVGGDSPSQLVEAIRRRQEDGFRHVKMNAVGKTEWVESPASINHIVAQVTEIREEIGWDIGVGLDFHGRVRKAMAKQLAHKLSPLQPMFLEEPLLPEHLDALGQVARHTATPIATGERMFGRWDFKKLFEEGWVDIIQPDLSHTGGLWEARKIAAMAETYDIAVAPHCPLGPIGLAASLQLDFCTPNALLQETSQGIHYHKDSADLLDYVVNPDIFRISDGYIRRSDQPGLGVNIDEGKVREAAQKGHNWHNPIWRGKDGAIIEW